MHTDTTLLHAFMILKGQPHTEVSNDTKQLLETNLTLDVLRQQVITEARTDLIQQFLSLEWNEISTETNVNVFTKTIVKNYLMNVLTRETFITIYNLLQRRIANAGDILYYLNPLKFSGYESIAMNEMYIDATLDYSGFISACRVKRITDTTLHSFIQRLAKCEQNSQSHDKVTPLNSYHRKYEKIIARPQKDRYSS